MTDVFQKAVLTKFRMQVNVNGTTGRMAAENLADLSLAKLAELIVERHEIVKEEETNSDLGFLRGAIKKESSVKFEYDLLKEIFLIKQKKADELAEAAASKPEKEALLARKAAIQAEKFNNMSEEEINKRLKELA